MLLKFKLIFLLFIAIIVKQSNSKQCEAIAGNNRIDCAPDQPNNEELCNQRKCCFIKAYSTNGMQLNKLFNYYQIINDLFFSYFEVHIPSCFMSTHYIGYSVKQIKKDFAHILITLERVILSGLPNDIKTVSVEITFLKNKSLRIKLLDSVKQRYEVPLPKLNLPEFPIAFEPLYEIDVTQSGK
jgi:hypothetical protein